MATKPATPAQRWVLIEFQYQKFVMPMEDGMTLFEAMTSMEPVEYSYDEKVWKPAKGGSASNPTLRVFSALEYAQLSLEDKPT